MRWGGNGERRVEKEGEMEWVERGKKRDGERGKCDEKVVEQKA